MSSLIKLLISLLLAGLALLALSVLPGAGVAPSDSIDPPQCELVVLFSPLNLLAVFTLTICGALIYFQAPSWIGKICGLLVATFVSWAPLVFGLLLVAAINIFFSTPETGTALYNYSLSLIPAGSFALTFALSGLAFWYANRWINPGGRGLAPTPSDSLG